MSSNADELAAQYANALRAYLQNPEERTLEPAYSLGRLMIFKRSGVMALASAHQEAVLSVLSSARGAEELKRLCQLAGAFFIESLWPIEVIQRGFAEANLVLQNLNTQLAERARELSVANSRLSQEIAERREVEEALRRSERSLRQLSSQILFAQEEERKRISRELHDEVGQALTAINMNLTMLRNSPGARAVAAKVTDLQGLLQQTMETIHNFTRELRPAMLDHLGLIPALRAYVRSFRKRTGLSIRFRAAAEAELLGIEEKTVLYRVTQEGLTNVVRHAGASRATVLIQKADDQIRMEVHDNGRSFHPEIILRAKGRRRLGLLGIQERVRLVKGDFTLESEPGKGTRIRVNLPLKIGGAKSN